jgi:hypothetical protein
VFGYAMVFIRCLLVLVLAVSAAGKVADRVARQEFARTLQQGLHLPQARLLAGLWVTGEAVTALLLALPPTAGAAAVLATCEFGCLTVGVALLVAQRRGFRCSCFGGSGSELDRWAVLRNGTLTLAALVLAAGLRQPAATAPAPVALAAILTVLVGSVLVWQARSLRTLVEGAAIRRPGTPSTTGSARVGAGRR